MAKKIRDRKYLATYEWRTCMCKRDGVECGAPAIPHHLLRSGEHSMGSKAGDDHTVPLCALHHDKLHRGGDEVAFFAHYEWAYNDVKNLTKMLYKNYKNGHVSWI